MIGQPTARTQRIVPLRANLSRVQAESHEILQAIEELNQM